MKLIIILIILLSASQNFAATCARCQATMGLRKIDKVYYCNKHYCTKHKIVKTYEKCAQCDLQSLIARGKATCHLCSAKSKLIVARKPGSFSDGSNYGGLWGTGTTLEETPFAIYCPKHFCVEHKLAFKEDSSEAKSHYCEKCLIAHKLRTLDQPLGSLFGAPLGGSPEGIIQVKPGVEYYSFTPAKKFREFNDYYLDVVDNKIVGISASKKFDYVDDADAEFSRIVDILDLKYGAERRSRISSESYREKYCYYNFATTNGENAKQRLSVRYSRIEGTIADYKLHITAYLADDLHKQVNKRESADADAL